MEDKDYIKELFSEKLRNQEAPVNPELWSAISSSIGSSAATASGLTLVAKLAIGISAAVAITVASVLVLQDDEKPDKISTQAQTTPKGETKSKAVNSETLTVTQLEEPLKAKITPENTAKKDNPVAETIASPELKDNPLESNVVERAKTSPSITPQTEPEANPSENKAESAKPAGTGNATAVNTPPKVKYTVGKLPNVFSPNGDNIHDVFFIESNGLLDYSLTILNDKGKTVFSSTDPNFKWDGTDLSGEAVPEGEYIYFFVAKDEANNPVSKSSNLTIIRKK